MPSISTVDLPDRDGSVYLMTDELRVAVRVALATGRPLLLCGEPGSGKSSLAPFIAKQEGWRFCKHVVTARSQAQDLLWTFDSVRRLADAQVRRTGSEQMHDHRYVEPGALWWAFAPDSARRRGRPQNDVPDKDNHEATDPRDEENQDRKFQDHAVLLIDEIDKADPDFPNGLLVPLGSGEFEVTETGQPVYKEPAGEQTLPGTEFTDGGLARHLVVVTTNGERELPPAFLRRCVVAWLPEPKPQRLIDIAEAHHRAEFGAPDPQDMELARELASVLVQARQEAENDARRRPNTAEFLDAYRACRQLDIRPGHDLWTQLRNLVLLKKPPSDREAHNHAG